MDEREQLLQRIEQKLIELILLDEDEALRAMEQILRTIDK